MSTSPPKRLVYCVDGTWCGPDGSGPNCATLTNVYQIFASIEDSTKTGSVVTDGYFQIPRYETGIGSADETRTMNKIRAGVFGDGYLQQIQKIYEECCKLNGHDDEVWLFGFSRGAFVVRAVAGLLHFLRAISSAGTPAFAKDYGKALKVYKSMQKQEKLGPGQIHEFLSATTRPAPKIKFVGVFDTVKAVNDRSLFDISLNDSIKHLRHALALHEDREAMTPEYIFPDTRTRLQQPERSFIQAWFVGAHIDLGGSSANAGLSLYPLQWMLLEGQSRGLILKFSGTYGKRASIDNPLQLVFPATEEEGKGADLWSCKMKNGVEVQMQDLRRVTVPNQHDGRYTIKLHRHHATLWPKRRRDIFSDDGHLNGWTHFPQGTIIHPSVYLLIDENFNISLDTKDQKLQNSIDRCRAQTLGTKHDILNPGFWSERSTEEFEDLGAIRVLVCGNTGVGKSTLINKVFGVPVAEASDRKRGEHDVRVPLEFEGRKDLIVHDSRGFEAGAVGEMETVKCFLQEKSRATDIKDRLHVIWFCMELNTARTMQQSTEKLYKAISQYSEEVPIVVVATKMDDFIGAKFQERRQFLKNNGKPMDMEDCDRYAEDELRNRILLMKKEMLAVEGGRLDACVPVSKDDKESFQNLTETTSRCFNSEKIRILYIRAQVTKIELKINLATEEVMKIYKRSIRGAAAAAGIPIAPTATRTGAAVDVCRNLVLCFGVSAVTGEMALEIMKANVWDDLGNNLIIALSEGLAAVGMAGTVAAAGLPFFLLTGAVNIPLAVPATARLLLMLAADMILILARSFREASVRNVGQPSPKDLGAAARAYRPFSEEVHKKIKKLLPRKNPTTCFRTDKIRIGFEKIIEEYRNLVIDGIAVPKAERFGESDDDYSNVDADGTLVDDMIDATKELDDVKRKPDTSQVG